MLTTFDEIIEITLHHEGGYVHDPNDLGGETNFGIAKRFYPDEDIKNLINGCANITGGGISENIKRVIPDNFCASIDLKKIKTLKIFKWLKKNDISDKEMLKTFNCGVGFCLIISPKYIKKINKFFSKEYKPYVIGKISKNRNKVSLNGKVNWL